MTNESRTDVRVGVTVILGIAMLLIGIAWAKNWTSTSNEHLKQAVFPSAGGLQPGDPVTVNGVKLGVVRDVNVRHSDVLVTLAFETKMNLRSDASAEISMLELMSGKKVEVFLGSSPDPMPENAVIPGVYAGDISSLVSTINTLAVSLENVAGRTDTLFDFVNNLTKGHELQGKIDATFTDAQRTLRLLGDAADEATKVLAENRLAIKHTMAQADILTNDLSDVLHENRPAFKMFMDSSTRALAEGRELFAHASSLAVKLDSIVSGAGQPGTFMYRLMKDTVFAHRVDSTVYSLEKLTEQLRFQGIDANIRFFNSSKPLK